VGDRLHGVKEYLVWEEESGKWASVVSSQKYAVRESKKKTYMYLINCIDVHMSVTHLLITLMVVIVQFPNSCSFQMPNSMHTCNGISVP
jgi:hypothetical protein